MIKVLTPTGERWQTFQQCWHMMRAQSICEPVQWLIVDDGRVPYQLADLPRLPDNWGVSHIRPTPLWTPGENTQARNLLVGLEHVESLDRLVIVEDDDQYEPWWIAECAEWLKLFDLMGEAPSLYVNFASGRRQYMANRSHASLCSTALTRRAIQVLREVCENHSTYIDVELWKADVVKSIRPPKPRGVIGRKGLPGRPGIGVGHRL